ncbi:MAG: isoprenoid biosynthesis glyoxalase ElbB [Fidelibacterota bacterium]|nr:MAG: isoprenoid biosynthesis glyoxalase ElbB [Candidatus Neomarinimicrobiota bacterium]
MPTVGVCLAGCGFLDGAEIFESVATLYNLEKAGADIVAMAPDIDQAHVVNHVTGDVMEGESRNVLVEAARIVRGDIKDIADVSAEDIDALIFPGGYGVAKNLSTYAFERFNCQVNDEVDRLVRETIAANKPLGVICIAPAMLAKVLEGLGVNTQVTIGNDPQTAQDIEDMGTTHVTCSVTKHITDKENKIVSTPAYMLANKIGETWVGIEGLVNEVLALIDA